MASASSRRTTLARSARRSSGCTCPGTRGWVVAEAQAWLNDAAADKLFWLMGGAGTGKTVVSALLLDRLGVSHIPAHHFCLHTDPDASQPRKILLSMSAQLCRDLPGYQEKLVGGGEDHSAKVKAVIAGEVEKLEEMFDALLLKPLAAMGAEGLGWQSRRAAHRRVGRAVGRREPSKRAAAACRPFSQAAKVGARDCDVPRREQDQKVLERAYTPLELRVDEARNQQDVRAFLAHIASQHVAKTISIADLEIAVEAKFPGTNIRGKLGVLERPMQLSLACYDKAVDEIVEDPDYEQLCKGVEELRPTNLGQSVDDMDALYGHATAAHEKLCNAVAKEWQDGKPFAFLRVPVEGTAAAWVDKAINPGVKGKERATEKLEKDYGGDVTKLKDLARCTLNFATCGEMIAAIEELKKLDGFSVVQLKNKYKNPTPLGYRDLNLCVAVEVDDGNGGKSRTSARCS